MAAAGLFILIALLSFNTNDGTSNSFSSEAGYRNFCGMIGAQITAVPGSSASYVGGVVAYSNELKQRLLTVPKGVLSSSGAVSRETALAMADGARTLGAECGLAVTGIAGPDGGSDDKPVGTVHIAAATPAGESAIGVVRLSGAGCLELSRAFLRWAGPPSPRVAARAEARRGGVPQRPRPKSTSRCTFSGREREAPFAKLAARRSESTVASRRARATAAACSGKGGASSTIGARTTRSLVRKQPAPGTGRQAHDRWPVAVATSRPRGAGGRGRGSARRHRGLILVGAQ